MLPSERKKLIASTKNFCQKSQEKYLVSKLRKPIKPREMQWSNLRDLWVNLMQFVTGSDVMLCYHFTWLDGLQRRPVAHMWTFTLEILRTYQCFPFWKQITHGKWIFFTTLQVSSLMLKSNGCSFSLLSTTSKSNYENVVVKMMLLDELLSLIILEREQSDYTT